MNRTELREVSVTSLTNGGYVSKLMQAERLTGEHVHGLPPGKPIMAIPIHCLPGAPEGWVRDPGSYVVEVDAQHGLWFDWTDNDKYNVAIVPTVKGMNPITGTKTEDVGMHQYREKCPVHDIPFAHNYYCEKCGYHWPPQNYVSHPNILWWDGFRQPDGSVRQFFFTEEDRRDVTSAVIGKKNTVPAFGFAFYRCKNDRRPKQEVISRGIQICSAGYVGADPEEGDLLNFCGDDLMDYHTSDNTKGSTGEVKADWSYTSSVSSSSNSSSSSKSYGSKLKAHNSKSAFAGTSNNVLRKVSSRMVQPRRRALEHGEHNPKFDPDQAQERFNKDVSVGAGAKIAQNLEIDQTPLDEWGEKPEAVTTLYFVFSEQLEQIIEKGGIKRLEDKKEGYLENVPVG